MATRFEGWERWATLLLQVVLGVIFVLHGAQKLFGAFGGAGISGLGTYFDKIGISPGLFWAWVVGCVEFFGGLCVLFGFLTRIAGAALVIDMTVAVFKVHFPAFFWTKAGLEMPMTLGVIALSLVLSGPSFLSLDRLLGLEKRAS
jgi:putative oxidoreductase